MIATTGDRYPAERYQSMSAYQLNKLLHELKSAENVKEALVNRNNLMERYRLTPDELNPLEAENLTALYRIRPRAAFA